MMLHDESRFSVWEPNDWTAYATEEGVTSLMNEVNRLLAEVQVKEMDNDRLRSVIIEIHPFMELLDEWK